MHDISTDPDEVEAQCQGFMFDPIESTATEAEVLDYMVMHLCRYFEAKRWLLLGGYAMTKILHKTARMTTDIDVNMLEEDRAQVIGFFSALFDNLVKNKCIAKYEVKAKTTYSVKLVTFRKNELSQNKKFVGCDIHFAEMYGSRKVNILGMDVNVSTPEHMLADKMMTCQGKSPWKRMKDFYDIYILSDYAEFGMQEVLNCLRKRDFVYDPQNYPFTEEKLLELERHWANNTRTRMAGEEAVLVTWKQIARRFDQVAMTLVMAYEEGSDINAVWDPTHHYWEEEK